MPFLVWQQQYLIACGNVTPGSKAARFILYSCYFSPLLTA